MRLHLTSPKALLLGLTLLALAPRDGHSQNAEKKTGLSLYGSTLQYHGDLGTEWFKNDKIEFGAGLKLSRYLTPGLDLGLDLSYGEMAFSADPPYNMNQAFSGFRANVVNIGIPVTLKLNNGWALKEDAFFAPYLSLAPGIFFASTDRFKVTGGTPDNRDLYAFDIHGAAGIRLNFSSSVSAFIQTGQHYILTDQIDGITEKGHINDRYLQHTAGLTFNFGKTIDTDGDGVSDKKDKCPGTPTGVAVDANGCPLDGDGDGVPDYQDKCPTEKGLATLEGCPDRDGDGVRDGDDACPDTPGKAELRGCPDADNDGVIDSADKCPGTPAGVKVDANGCPVDSDGDGVPDYQDRCPQRPGPASNKGCPEMKVEEKKKLQEATKYIQFEFDKATLKPISFPTLNGLVEILNAYPDYSLGISAHADNKGDDAYNLRLSDARAASARTYMLSKGIPADRIVSHGYGETKPIADNATEAGRAINRRVEFDVYLPGDPNPAETKYGPAPEIPAAPVKAAPVKKAPVKKAPVKKAAPARRK
ncbi:OmpA family protein [Hymenobacter chitinivorans]|uniref:Outer membrane protein OmpA-like peptidoglycan-associated protein n=1 Tax=Hymenobacter chitinivorans DSM 11115 TaxID=1121954 RepID=A0A2M9BKZ8_9BACT|nr:OmpA family protein [Hymenobacter chitinivorans]PJJ58629.1 outer membrane protein OmpA-like peptidoglycan-associated protein [Hymenobacter chitinivorans DSM 11115]